MSHGRSLTLLTTAGLALALATGCQGSGVHGGPSTVRDGVFVHVTKGAENPHAVLMALKMASLMSEDRDALMYFDLTGVNVVLKDSEDLSFRAFDSSKAQLDGLIEKGVPLYVCPGCLKAAGKTPEDVMPGVKIANKQAFFDFTEGRILTLDY